MSVSLVSPVFVAVLAAATVVLGVTAALAHHRGARLVAVLLSVLLLLLTAAAGVNEYFDYIPTSAALLGRRAADQATPAKIARVEARSLARGRPPVRGAVELVDIPPLRSGFRTRAAQVYLPPAWFATPRPQLPVLLLLHGTPGSPTDWTRAGFADVTADRWATAHGGVAPILVMADENGGFTRDTECVGPSETYLVDDIHDWAVRTLDARPDRSGWAVGGYSEGGWCAVMLAARHPDRFSAFLDFSGLDRPTHHGGVRALFGGRRRDLRTHLLPSLLHRPLASPVAGWFEVGSADGGTTRAVRHAAALARRDGLDVHLVLIPHAHHTWRVSRSCLRNSFDWIATRLTGSA